MSWGKIGPILDRLTPDPKARVFFELMSGALVWSDEVPPPSGFPEEGDPPAWGLRGIWHYRSSLIEGCPVEKFREKWEEAQRCFPNWPGFDPRRRDPSLKETLVSLRVAGMKKFDEDMARIEAEFEKKKAPRATA